MEKVKIVLKDYDYECADGCCNLYGTITTVNGKELEIHNSDRATIIQYILTELGFDSEVIEEYEEF